MIQVVRIDIGKDLTTVGEEILRAVEEGLDEVAQAVLADFGSTVSTWQDKPEFDIQKEPMSRTIGTNDQNYAYVNSGTKVRYATMTRDFQAKTEPNVLQAQAGQGGLSFVSKRVPRPGIKARNFDKVIAEKYQEQAAEIIQAKINAVP